MELQPQHHCHGHRHRRRHHHLRHHHHCSRHQCPRRRRRHPTHVHDHFEGLLRTLPLPLPQQFSTYSALLLFWPKRSKLITDDKTFKSLRKN